MAYMYMYTNIYVHEYLAKMHCNFFFFKFSGLHIILMQKSKLKNQKPNILLGV